jgi:hypothetical protein
MTKKSNIAGIAGSAIGISGFATALGLCCGLPWAVALLGVSGAIALARLAFLLPYALIGAGALLTIGFWLAYRKPHCDDGQCREASNQGQRVLMWIAALIVGVLASVALLSRVTV